MKRILVWFSCGAASAVAAKMCVEEFGSTHEVLIVNCDTRSSEHPDNYRFCADCVKWWGQEIVFIKSDKFQTVDEVFDKTRYMAGVAGARCTTELKKLPRMDFARADDIHVFGFCFDEQKRVRQFEDRNPDLIVKWVLIEKRITKARCYQELTDAGIELPEMYKLGYDNNNCPGCVKASSPWYWSMIRKTHPEVFKRRCEQSRALGVRLVEIHHHERIFLDELPDREFKKRGQENLSCGPECGQQQLNFA